MSVSASPEEVPRESSAGTAKKKKTRPLALWMAPSGEMGVPKGPGLGTTCLGPGLPLL